VGRGGVAVAARKPILFHLSDTSTRANGLEPHAEVREVFPAASFSGQWGRG
jgi:hypothetical protein